MPRDDIIKMAREAGLFVPQAGIPESGALMRFAALVRADEREQCAEFCESFSDGRYIAAAIRARGQE